MEQWQIQDITFTIHRKPVKTLRITLRPPLAEPQVTVPLLMPKARVSQFLEQKIPWVKKHQKRINHQHREPEKTYHQGEEHRFFGQVVSLDLRETQGKPWVELNGTNLIVHGKPTLSKERLASLVHEFYRLSLKERVPQLIQTYEPIMGVKVLDWGIKSMKTRWGTCNPRAKRIWVNLELAKLDPKYLEYLVVHEMVHLLEPSHNSRFYGLMGQFYPDWKVVRNEMNHWGLR